LFIGTKTFILSVVPYKKHANILTCSVFHYQTMNKTQNRTKQRIALQPLATASQKENFKSKFTDIVKQNTQLINQFSIIFFDTTRTNYVINGLDGQSMNVISYLSEEELDAYRLLKNNWRDIR
jgi:negative regulator of sigma E activity